MNSLLEQVSDVLHPQAIQTLNSILYDVTETIKNTREKLSPDVQSIIQSTTARSELREDKPDLIVVEITFFYHFESKRSDAKASLSTTKSFAVPCLSDNVKELTEKHFKDTVMSFVETCGLFFYEVGDVFHEMHDSMQ